MTSSNSTWIATNDYLFIELLGDRIYYYRAKAGVQVGGNFYGAAWSEWVQSVQLSEGGDYDGDGVANAWEDVFGYDPLDGSDGNLDTDGDGMTTVEEFGADTIPTNAESNLQMLEISHDDSGFSVMWRGGIMATQFIEYSDDLRNGTWTPLFTNMPPTAVTNLFEMQGQGTYRIFRVRTSR